MMEEVSIISAFLFGLLSFVSPCVLPIVPGYLSFISGVSFEEMQAGANTSLVRNRIILNSLFFVIGFSIVFIALGASASFIGHFLKQYLHTISKIAGVVIILFGIHMIGLIKIPFLNYEKRFHAGSKPLGLLGSLLVGLAFAFGWTPCIGPILAGILAIAAQQENIGRGIVLLGCYSAGLGIPFILTGASLSFFLPTFNKLKRHLHTVEIVSGSMLVIIGIMIFTNSLTLISAYLSKWFPFLSTIG